MQRPGNETTLNDNFMHTGIPKQKRGQVWQFFIQQRKLDGDGGASSHGHINLEIPYEQLLRQLTSQQHAILIDLGTV